MDVETAVWNATLAGSLAKCAKSKRGVFIWDAEGGIAGGENSPPNGFSCDGSALCRTSCGKVAVHAEQRAILAAIRIGTAGRLRGAEMLHTKVEFREGSASSVPGGPPSCPDCSKLILESGIAGMWLIEERDGKATPVRYTAAEFHDQTLRNCGLHPYRLP